AKLLNTDTDFVISPVPYKIDPIEVKMIWSPLLPQAPAHLWIRRVLLEFAKTIADM
ncbi:LysR family transcriptional regulator, partial [Pseudoalteromonas sp. S1731]